MIVGMQRFAFYSLSAIVHGCVRTAPPNAKRSSCTSVVVQYLPLCRAVDAILFWIAEGMA